MGDFPKNEKELIISDFLLGEFGVTEQEQSSLIGKKVSLYCEDGAYALCEDYILTGIFRAELLEEREKKGVFNNLQHIYMNFDAETKEKYEAPDGVIRYYVNDYEKLLGAEQSKMQRNWGVKLILLWRGVYTR